MNQRKQRHIKRLRSDARRARRRELAAQPINPLVELDKRLSIFNLMPYGASFKLQRDIEESIGLEKSLFADKSTILTKAFLLDNGEVLALLAASFNEDDALGDLTLNKVLINKTYGDHGLVLVGMHLDKDHKRVTLPGGLWLEDNKGPIRQLDESDQIEFVDFGEFRVADVAAAFTEVQEANTFIAEHLQKHGESKISLSRGGEIRVKK